MANAFIPEEELMVYYANRMEAISESLDAIIRKTERTVSDITFAWKGRAAENTAEKLWEFATEMRSAKNEIEQAKSEILIGIVAE